MKKKLLLSLALIMGSVLAFSQAQVAVGLKGGLNFAKLDVNSSVSDNYENRTGFHGGAFVLVKLSKIGIQPEIIFSKQGADYKQALSATTFQNIENSFDYINIPIMLKLYTVAGINLQAGPQFGFLSGGEIKSTIAGITTTLDAKDYVKGSDLSLALGAGWDLPFGLTIDARYNLGLSKINDASGSDDTKNRVFQISAGYKLFKFGK